MFIDHQEFKDFAYVESLALHQINELNPIIPFYR